MHAHYCHLLVHGTLHLLGHDHMEAAAAAAMEGLEISVLAALGIDDPYQIGAAE
jgi:probable rRNA maturation factor